MQDMCHWEPHVARPAPQKPPSISIASTGANATVEALSARIAVLEAALRKQAGKDTAEASPTPPESSEISANMPETNLDARSIVKPTASDSEAVDRQQSRWSDMEDEQGPRALIDYNVQVAAVALAQLSLAPRTEFVGSGTVLCAIHKARFFILICAVQTC